MKSATAEINSLLRAPERSVKINSCIRAPERSAKLSRRARQADNPLRQIESAITWGAFWLHRNYWPSFR